MQRRWRPLVNLLTGMMVFAGIPPLTPTTLQAQTVRAISATASPSQQVSQARTELEQGKGLLRRNRADKALGHFETALHLFEQAGDSSGRAAAQDGLGDIYARQGQYQIALRYYQGAQEAFRAKNETYNVNLMFAKIGEAYYRLGDLSEARLAFAQMTEQKKDSSSPGGLLAGGAGGRLPDLANNGLGNSGNASSNSSGSGANNSSSASNSASSCSPAAANPLNAPNQGVAPKNPDGLGRIDLRVFDEAGNPVKGAKTKIESKRPNGLLCSSEGPTDAFGRALLNPLHVGKLKVEVKADGFHPVKIDIPAEALAEPVKLTLQSKNGVAALGGVSSAASMLGACMDMYRQFTNQATSELGQGRADMLGNQLDAARGHFESVLASSSLVALAGFGRTRRARVAAQTSLGDIAFRQGRYADAIKLYNEAIEGARKDGRLDLVWAAQRGIGKTLWVLASQEKDTNKAWKLRMDGINAYREAIKTIETIRAGSLRADEARTTFVATTKDVFDEASNALAEMALTDAPATGPLGGQALNYAAEAFKIVEQGRARSLLDLMDEGKVEITEGIPAELVKRRADNLARQQEIADTLTGIAVAGETPKQSVGELEAELDRLATEFESIDNQIRVASPRFASLTSTQPLTLGEVQRQLLDDKTALLEYSLGSERSYLWAVTRNGLSLYRLPARATLDQQAMDLRSQLIPAALRRQIVGIDVAGGQTQRGLNVSAAPVPKDVTAYAEAAHKLYQTAVAPAAPVIGDKRLVVVADGALNYVPFEALVTAAGGADYAALPYLIKTNEVVYAPSASVIAAGRQQATAASPSRSILVVADPVFDPSDPRAKGAPATGSGLQGATRGLALKTALSEVTNSPATQAPTGRWRIVRLDGTRTEAEQIAQLARSTGGQADVWLDLDASEANVRKREIKQYRILHFATHGLLNAEQPQFTGLVLSLVGDPDDDGFLRAQEVFNLRLGSPFVMLSACETGLGKEKRGEGVIGLTRAFMYAGAPTVGVTLWSVADDSTAELMPNFYKRLLAGQVAAPASALRAAQQEMIAGKRFSAPYYWAPFVLVGDWR